jgi:hypothetical protein
MNDRTEGAWILSHANKLAQIENHDFEDIDMAGKAGKLLSEESILSKEKVSAIAKIAGINKAELPTLLRILKSEELIDKSVNGEVVALGVTTTAVLGHTSKVFNSLNPSKSQKAAISLAESISAEPMLEKEVKEEISDLFKMKKKEIDDVFAQSEDRH